MRRTIEAAGRRFRACWIHSSGRVHAMKSLRFLPTVLAGLALVWSSGLPAQESPPAAGAAAAPDAAEPVVVALPDPGASPRLTVGQRLQVRLKGNPTTGYRWDMVKLEGTALRAGAASYIRQAAEPDRVGVGGVFLFEFDAVEAGQAKLTFHYQRPWLKDKQPPHTTATLAVVVQAAGGGAATAPAGDATEAEEREVVGADGTRFPCRERPMESAGAIRVLRLTFPSPVVTPNEQNNTVPADLYLPPGMQPGGPRRPAVVCLHILNGNFELERLTCSMLASRGVPAVLIKLPYYGERELPGGRRALMENPRLFIEALPQGLADVRRTIDVLASRDEVDPQRIGLVGISMGAILAASAAGADARVERVALVLGGGDLKGIIAQAHETRPLQEFIDRLPADQASGLQDALDQVEPLRFADALRPRAQAGRVLMINATDDQVVPRAATEKLAGALDIADRVVWLDGLGHYTAVAQLPQILDRVTGFFAEGLPAELQNPPTAAPAGAPSVVLSGIARQLASFLNTEPAAGRFHGIDLEIHVKTGESRGYDGQLRLFRGSGQQFRVEGDLPEVGAIRLGQGAFPWLVSSKGRVYRGVKGDVQGRLSDGVAERNRQAVQAVGAVLSLAGSMPTMVEQFLTVSETAPADGFRTLELALKDRPSAQGLAVLDRDGKTLREVSARVGDADVRILVRSLQTDAVTINGLFEPPAGLESEDVAPSDLHRMFAAMFNFLMESIR